MSSHLTSAWAAQPEAVQAALIGGASTLAAAILAGGFVFYQIGRQAQLSRELEATNAANQLKMRIYEQVVSDHEKLIDAEVAVMSVLQRYSMELPGARGLQAMGAKVVPPKVRTPDLFTKNENFSRAAIDIVIKVESWEIVDPRLRVFLPAINAALYDYNQLFQAAVPLFIKLYPMELPSTGEVLPWGPPDLEVQAEYERRVRDILNAQSIVGTYAADFRTEMQLALLGDVFPGRKLDRRVPLDPRLKVIRLDRWKELTRYFENETAWGAAMKEAEQRALGSFDVPEPEPNRLRRAWAALRARFRMIFARR